MGWRFYLIRRQQIGKALVLPNIQRCYDKNNGLRIDVIQSMRRVLGVEEINQNFKAGAGMYNKVNG